jgi:thiamine pyrophosphokinase
MANLMSQKNSWEQFLKELGEAPELDIVGPLYQRPHFADKPTVYVDQGADFSSIETLSFATVKVGDGDSSQQALDHQLPQDKDYSDLAFVLRRLPRSLRILNLLGFLGGRRDHELLNYGEAHHFLTRQTRFTRINFDQQIVAFCGGTVHLNLHGVFSVVVFAPTAVTITGACRYPVKSAQTLAPVSSQGLSNEGSGEVKIDSHGPCFVFCTK